MQVHTGRVLFLTSTDVDGDEKSFLFDFTKLSFADAVVREGLFVSFKHSRSRRGISLAVGGS